jgi:hypothetical protein
MKKKTLKKKKKITTATRELRERRKGTCSRK